MHELQDKTLYQLGFMPGAEVLNHNILQAYLNLGEKDFFRRSHFFGGRFENLYLEKSQIPEIDLLMQQAVHYAAAHLGMPSESIRSGFWINDAYPGQRTSLHDHVEYDELLSGVYYVSVPDHSGNLILYDKDMPVEVVPQEGMFVFFSPDILHEVAVNQSEGRRISIGMNFGPCADTLTAQKSH